MPIQLPVLLNREPRPLAPDMLAWLALFVVFMLVGVAYTLLTWPKGEPTNTPLFWACLLARPALAWLIALAIRKIAYDRKTQQLDADERVAQQDRAEAIEFGSEPLAVVASTYQCAMGAEKITTAILQGGAKLESQQSRVSEQLVRHTKLTLFEDEHNPNRYEALMQGLIGALRKVLQVVPADTPIDIYLQLPANSNQDELMALWKNCWRDFNLRPTKVNLLPAEQGVMALDEWLDVYGGPKLQKLTLFVALQLHEEPPPDSAEAGVALLLCWPLVAVRKKLPTLAMLHRPLESTPEILNDAIPIALLWGKAGVEEVNHVWQTGLNKKDKAALNTASAAIKLGAASSDGLSGFHDVDNALGYAGAAASWLSIALAIENARQSKQPQMIVCHEGSLRLALVQPVGNDKETKAT